MGGGSSKSNHVSKNSEPKEKKNNSSKQDKKGNDLIDDKQAKLDDPVICGLENCGDNQPTPIDKATAWDFITSLYEYCSNSK
jgi:hypothetical protein